MTTPPTPLLRAAEIVLGGILAQIPGLSPNRLDLLLLRVSQVHRRRVERSATSEDLADRGAYLAHRLLPAAELVARNPAPPPPRGGNKHQAQRNAAGELVCIICSEVLVWPRRGRAPVYCPTHRSPSSRLPRPKAK
jgi:hypothetical protein